MTTDPSPTTHRQDPAAPHHPDPVAPHRPDPAAPHHPVATHRPDPAAAHRPAAVHPLDPLATHRPAAPHSPDAAAMQPDGVEGDASELLARVADHSRAVVEVELRRLARRTPSLRPDSLDAIGAALDELVESLLLARLRTVPRQHTARLRLLFDTSTEAP